jgi:pimeloyl-ACP methyl ester carboxylesterase
MLPARFPFTPDTRQLRSFDGTEIAYRVTQAFGAPWVVLAGGLGGGQLVWRGAIDYLRDRYRFVSWDPRGLDASERPRPERPDGYAVASHVRDLEGILAAERIERATFVGWSTGAQVAIEASRRLRGRAASLVLVNGTGGSGSGRGRWIEVFRRARALGRFAHRPLGPRRAAAWVQRLGLVGRTADPAALAELTAAFGQLDLDALLRNLRAFADHDARAALAAVDVPALVIAGDRDPLVPAELAQQMARSIAGAELVVVRGGAHCAPVEYPELVSLRLERFLCEHGP